MFYLVDKTEDLTLGHNISNNSETVLKGQGGSQDMQEFLQQRLRSGNIKRFSSVQFSSVAQLCPILCNPMGCSTPGFPVHHQLLELAQTHVHPVGYPITSSSVVPFSSRLQSFPAQAIANCKTGLLDKHKRSEDTEY